jgi:peptidoglycan-associated lipoprotein
VKKIKSISLIGLAISTGLLSGCSGTRQDADAPIVRNRLGGASHGYNQYGSISAEDMDFYGKEQFSPAMREQIGHLPRNLNFGFDKYKVGPKQRPAVKENAKFLIAHPDIPIMLTGNTDPRGSQSYNFHLGQRRADSVKSELLKDGVPASQICTVSYGELRPAASPDEFDGDWLKAYGLDRRVEFVYGQTCKDENK